MLMSLTYRELCSFQFIVVVDWRALKFVRNVYIREGRKLGSGTCSAPGASQYESSERIPCTGMCTVGEMLHRRTRTHTHCSSVNICACIHLLKNIMAEPLWHRQRGTDCRTTPPAEHRYSTDRKLCRMQRNSSLWIDSPTEPRVRQTSSYISQRLFHLPQLFFCTCQSVTCRLDISTDAFS